jgi:hypothetical protein
MRIYYRIVSIDPGEHSMVVRYWTDAQPEHSLASSHDADGNIRMTGEYPERCRTDCNHTLWDHEMTQAEIEDLIHTSAPRAWLELRESDLRESQTMTHLREIVGSSGIVPESAPTAPPEPVPVMTEDDIAALMKRLIG